MIAIRMCELPAHPPPRNAPPPSSSQDLLSPSRPVATCSRGENGGSAARACPTDIVHPLA
eukprot:363012-Chlamydomonas_euryale.AAC.9